MWSAIDIYRRLISIRMRAQLQYRVSFLLGLVASLFATATGFGTLALIFQRFDGIAGWTLGEVAFLYGMVETAFGFMDLFFGGFDPDTFGPLVQRGRFDQLLLRPINITIQVLGSDFVLRRLSRVVQGIAIFCIALALVDVQWTLAKIAYLPVVLFSMVGFFGGLFIVGSTTTFWTVQRVEVINIFTYGGSEMMAYPMHIYGKWMRRFFTYVVPAIFLNYCPALYFLDKPDPLHMPAFAPFLSPVAGFGVLAAALGFWRFGIRHYTSTGT
ncbi:MAG: ABC-2 family transporter protein [Chloroflexota bacterium]|nr:ABC-2 family transporter protein [Chloroflexota bacterium]